MSRFGYPPRNAGLTQSHGSGDFRTLVQIYPVPTNICSSSDLAGAVHSPLRVVYLPAGSLSTSDESLQALHAADKQVVATRGFLSAMSRSTRADLPFARQEDL